MAYWYDTYVPFASRTKAARPHGITRMSNLDAALVLWLWQRKDAIQSQRSRIMEYYMQHLRNFPGISFPQEHAPEFCVSRFYMRTAGLAATRNQRGKIVQDNPLVTDLSQNGIRTGYGYTLLNDDLGPEGSTLREEQYAWLDELIWLPVDHKHDVTQYEVVINAIKSFFATHSGANDASGF